MPHEEQEEHAVKKKTELEEDVEESQHMKKHGEDTSEFSHLAHGDDMKNVPKTTEPDYEKVKKPYGNDESDASKFANADEQFYQPNREGGVKKTSEIHYKTKSTGEQVPYARANTIGSPISSPLTKEHEPDTRSFAQKLADAPRKIKEKTEEIGYRAEQRYHEAREKPAQEAAEKLYASRKQENDLKFHRGEISESMHRAREIQYDTERKSSSIPIEKRLVGDINNLGAGGSIRGFTDTMVRGAVGTRTHDEVRSGMRPVSILEKVQADYRPSPQPHFRAGKGTKKMSPTKGTVVSTVKKSIDFGRGGFGASLGTGVGEAARSPAFNFNTPLFGAREEPKPQPKPRKKSRR